MICCGVWSPRLARMAGASIPLTPAVHQMIDIGPVPRFAGAKSAIEYPIVRDMDTNMYERQDGTGLEVGSYAHRPILHDPDEIPSVEEAALSPTEFPFTQDDFVEQMEHALELMPEIVGDESVGIKYAINGLLSLTPDGLPILGETPEVKGLWSAAAVWVKEGPGVGRALAEWMVEGEPEIDLQASDVARFHEHQKSVAHVKARASEHFNKTYGIVHPGEQWESNRGVRLSPFYERERELGAMFYETAGWERPHWYESNAGLVEEYGVEGREAEWDSRWWSPIINAEHLAMRDRAGDVRPHRLLRLRHRRARGARLRAAGGHAPDGREARARGLHAGAHPGRRLSLRPDGHAPRRRALPGGHRWGARHGGPQGLRRRAARGRQRADLRPHLELVHARALGPARPRHPRGHHRRRRLARGLPLRQLPHDRDGLAAGAGLAHLLRRRPRLGALRADRAGRRSSGTPSPRPASRTASCPSGIGVYGTTGRLEKCYRAFGFELDGEYDVVEAGMAWGKVKDQDFIGKEAHVRQREADPATVMCTLTVDDHTSSSGVKRYMLGGEPILTRDGAPLTDAKGRRSFVTSAGAGPSVGKHLLMSYLPPEYAEVGEELAVLYMGERYPVTVAVAGSTPLFDPDNERVKAAGAVVT